MRAFLSLILFTAFLGTSFHSYSAEPLERAGSTEIFTSDSSDSSLNSVENNSPVNPEINSPESLTATLSINAVPLTQSLSATLSASTSTVSIDFSRENFDNPIVEIRTSLGSLILELFPEEAPLAVANFLALAEGTKTWIDPESGEQIMRPLFDETIFHRVIDGFMIQGGSPTGLGDGGPGYQFPDEINARSLGLDKMLVLNDSGTAHPILAINTQEDFQQKILIPLYKEMMITSQEELEANIDTVNRRLRTMTVKESFENLGYQYTERVISRMPVRGVIAMANSGPNTNGSQFFINLVDTDWLSGKHSVFGKVRVGLDILDNIGKVAVDDQNRPIENVEILSIRQLEL